MKILNFFKSWLESGKVVDVTTARQKVEEVGFRRSLKSAGVLEEAEVKPMARHNSNYWPYLLAFFLIGGAVSGYVY